MRAQRITRSRPMTCGEPFPKGKLYVMLRFQRRESPKLCNARKNLCSQIGADTPWIFRQGITERRRKVVETLRGYRTITTRSIRVLPICVPCVMHRRGERAGDRTQTSSILYTKSRRLSTPNFPLSKGLWDSWREITPSPAPHNRSHKSPTTPPPERSPAKNHTALRRISRRESREEALPDSPRHPAMLVSSMRLASQSMSGSSPPPRSASGRTTK